MISKRPLSGVIGSNRLPVMELLPQWRVRFGSAQDQRGNNCIRISGSLSSLISLLTMCCQQQNRPFDIGLNVYIELNYPLKVYLPPQYIYGGCTCVFFKSNAQIKHASEFVLSIQYCQRQFALHCNKCFLFFPRRVCSHSWSFRSSYHCRHSRWCSPRQRYRKGEGSVTMEHVTQSQQLHFHRQIEQSPFISFARVEI